MKRALGQGLKLGFTTSSDISSVVMNKSFKFSGSQFFHLRNIKALEPKKISKCCYASRSYDLISHCNMEVTPRVLESYATRMLSSTSSSELGRLSLWPCNRGCIYFSWTSLPKLERIITNLVQG